MTAGGMSANEQLLRITADVADMRGDPVQCCGAVIQSGREQLLGCQPITGADHGYASRIQWRRHETHPLLVAAGPAATMPEQQYSAIGLCRRVNQQPLTDMALLDIGMFFADDAGAALPAAVGIALPELGQCFLWWVVFKTHAMACVVR